MSATNFQPGQRVLRVLSNDQKRLVKIYVEKYTAKDKSTNGEEQYKLEEELLQFDRDYRAALAQRTKPVHRLSSAFGKRSKTYPTEDESNMISIRQTNGSYKELDLDDLVSDISIRLNATSLNIEEDDIVLQGDDAEAIISGLCKRLSEFTIEAPDTITKRSSNTARKIKKSSLPSTRGSSDASDKTRYRRSLLSSGFLNSAAKSDTESRRGSSFSTSHRRLRAHRNSIERDAIYTNIEWLERPIKGFEPDNRPEHDLPVDERLKRRGEWRSIKKES